MEHAATCHRPAKMATQTIKGMYVNNEITAITRHRNRHDLASTLQLKSHYHVSSSRVPKTINQKRTEFNLRVVQRDRLLRISTPNDPRLRHTPHCADPPKREDHKANVEQPRMDGGPILLRRAKAQCPARLHAPRGATGVPHVVCGRWAAN